MGRYCILEDNDPTGNLSNAAKRAKAATKIEVLSLPKRSPELNVMDFAVWSEVERRLRAQEKKWPSTKHEARAASMRRAPCTLAQTTLPCQQHCSATTCPLRMLKQASPPHRASPTSARDRQIKLLILLLCNSWSAIVRPYSDIILPKKQSLLIYTSLS